MIELDDQPTPAGEALERARVAAVVDQLKAGVLQRRAERATAGVEASEARVRLLELKRRETVSEPVPVSPRPVLGRLLVFGRKAVYHLFLKWHARGVVEQQSAYNRAASQMIEELLGKVEAQGRELARLAHRLEALEQERAPRPASASPEEP